MGIRYGTGTPPPILEKSPNSVPFIRATDIKEGEIQEDDLLFIEKEQPSDMRKCLLNAGELIVVRSGVNTGDCAVVPEHLEGSYAAYDLIIRLKDEALPQFAAQFLDTLSGRAQLNVRKGRAAQPHLNAEEISTILIPLPPLPVQREMVEEMEGARETRRRKLAEADALLSSLDAFLLERLGLSVTKTLFPRFYAATLKDSWVRCDPDYHSPKFNELRRAIEISHHPVYDLGTLAPNPRTGFAAGREVQSFDEEEGIPHVRPLNITRHGELTFEGTKLVPRNSVQPDDKLLPDEVLLNNTNSTEWVGKTTVFEGQRECCCSNHITRLRPDPSLVLPWFLAAVLNAMRSTGYLGLLATNFVNQAGINTETLCALRLPIPSLDIQQEIVAEMARRRLGARRLHEEAAREWEAAKAHFEAGLLGGKTSQ